MVLQFTLLIRPEIFKNFLSGFIHIILKISDCDSLTISRDLLGNHFVTPIIIMSQYETLECCPHYE